jgi:hypothetical protein
MRFSRAKEEYIAIENTNVMRQKAASNRNRKLVALIFYVFKSGMDRMEIKQFLYEKLSVADSKLRYSRNVSNQYARIYKRLLL